MQERVPPGVLASGKSGLAYQKLQLFYFVQIPALQLLHIFLVNISTLGVANEIHTQFTIQIHIRYEYMHLSHSSVYTAKKQSCHTPSVPGLPVKRVVAAFNSSSVSTVSAEKLYNFLNNLIQIQLLLEECSQNLHGV